MKYLRLKLFLLIIGIPLCLFGQEEPKSPIIERIEIVGHEDIPLSDIQKILPFKTEDSFVRNQLKVAKDMISSLYRSRGYLDSKADVSFSETNGIVAVVIEIDEGPCYHFSETKVTGLSSVRMFVVLRELTYKKGDPYQPARLFKTQGRLYRTGLFKDVSIKMSTTSAKMVDILIHVNQQPMKWIKAGVGFGSEEKERLSLILAHNNFLRRAYKLELLNTLSRIWLESRLDFTNRYLFGTPTEFQAVTGWRKETREGYDLERVTGLVNFGRMLKYQLRGALRYRLERNVTFNVNPSIALTTPEKSSARSGGVALNQDTTDNFFFPNKGTRVGLQFDHTGGLFAGDQDFNKALFDGSVYQAVLEKSVLVFHVRTGAVKPFGASEAVPIYDRFFYGGANSVRGYKERGVGPKDNTGAPLGGNWMLGSSMEFRFPIWKKWKGATFIDGGQVSPKASEVGPSDWKYGSGIGIRYKTPVGPIRLDYGYKLNPDLDDKDRWRIHFTLGEPF
ncbi:hypothetical protein BVX98_00040 [bacterium F11]|nr:hypothetical protein BVX98_00040 [bacterium F11]